MLPGSADAVEFNSTSAKGVEGKEEEEVGIGTERQRKEDGDIRTGTEKQGGKDREGQYREREGRGAEMGEIEAGSERGVTLWFD